MKTKEELIRAVVEAARAWVAHNHEWVAEECVPSDPEHALLSSVEALDAAEREQGEPLHRCVDCANYNDISSECSRFGSLTSPKDRHCRAFTPRDTSRYAPECPTCGSTIRAERLVRYCRDCGCEWPPIDDTSRPDAREDRNHEQKDPHAHQPQASPPSAPAAEARNAVATGAQSRTEGEASSSRDEMGKVTDTSRHDARSGETPTASAGANEVRTPGQSGAGVTRTCGGCHWFSDCDVVYCDKACSDFTPKPSPAEEAKPQCSACGKVGARQMDGAFCRECSDFFRVSAERDQLRAENARKSATIERLTKALREIADADCSYGDGCPDNAGTRHGRCTPCFARAALEGEVPRG